MSDSYEELAKLNELKQKGIITEEEFTAKKQELLSGKQLKAKNGANESGAAPQKTKPKWYDKKGMVAVLCVILWPVGLYGLWKSNVFSKKWKVGGTLIVLMGLMMILSAGGNKSKEKSSSQPSVTSAPAAKASKASYRSDPSGEKSISVQQIFEDTTNWGGTNRNQVITGYVKQLSIPKDALGKGDNVTSISIGYDDKTLFMILDTPINPGDYKVGDQISIQGWFNLVSKSYGTGRGTVFTGPVSIMNWDYTKREKAPAIITVDDYFGKNMKLGRTPITIVGQVAQKRVDTNEIWIQLGSGAGTIQGEMSKSKINAKVKEQYESIQVGDRVAFKGSFNTEIMGTGYFTIEELILNPTF